MQHSTEDNYYSGGLAELVSSPSDLTYSFFSYWFTGSRSLGRAMDLLHMPYREVDVPILERKGNTLFVNLMAEEHVLYGSTIFIYKNRKDVHESPKLVLDIAKCFHPTNIMHTLRIVLIQSQWIANHQKVIADAEKFVNNIPDTSSCTSLREVDELLTYTVWPYVIAVGFLAEFYNQLLLQSVTTDRIGILRYISSKLAEDDWFFRSVADQAEVKLHNLRFSDYMDRYGFRADKDYELTCPRWHEIPDVIKGRIEQSIPLKKNRVDVLSVDKKVRVYIETSLALQRLRSESKRKTLVHIDALRTSIVKTLKKESDINNRTRSVLMHEHSGVYLPDRIIQQSSTGLSSISTGHGIGVSSGHVIGTIRHVSNNHALITKGTIGVFPNASPEFSFLYPKCKGLIFLHGGQTSHGAIVAREFGIPALIDAGGKSLKDNEKISLNGTTGEWSIVV